LGQVAGEIRSLGGEVVAIAVTAVYSQMRFAKDLGADFPMLSDWGRQVCAAFGVRYDVWKGHDGVAKRSVFVVDTDATIRYRWVTDDAEQVPDYAEVVDVFRRLRGGSAV
jgi:glutaredoxin-dependent peroxiredoxin